jgi:hypothetical protein
VVTLGPMAQVTLVYIKNVKNILRQKKNYGNSNISPCKNIILQKNPLKETKKSFKIS